MWGGRLGTAPAHLARRAVVVRQFINGNIAASGPDGPLAPMAQCKSVVDAIYYLLVVINPTLQAYRLPQLVPHNSRRAWT